MPKSVIEKLLNAIEAGDTKLMQGLYWPNAEIWRNTDGIVRGVKDSVAIVKTFVENFSNIKFEEQRLEAFSNGFVQQHRMTATAPDGSAISLHSCMVFRVKDDKIVRHDEYFDATMFAPVYKHLEGSIS
jgi:uncharacterized protein